MTKEELIKHLEHLAEYVKYSEDAPALREVIEMLKCSEVPNSSDTISRKAALDVIFPYCPDDDGTCSKNGDDLRNLLDDIENLPSVQPKPIRINLNESIKVKLTDWGKEIYYHQFDRTNQIAGREICKPKFPKEDENGYTEFQLWCFMELYGKHIGMTLQNVIEPLEIVYESEKGEKNERREREGMLQLSAQHQTR